MEAAINCVSRWRKSMETSTIDSAFIKRFFALNAKLRYVVAVR